MMSKVSFVGVCAVLFLEVVLSRGRRIIPADKPGQIHSHTGQFYSQVVAASAPVFTACSGWLRAKKIEKYMQQSHRCGVAGTGLKALDAHIDRVWQMIRSAHKALDKGLGPETLKVFVAPEWTFRRYPAEGATESYVPPISSQEMQYILEKLENLLRNSEEDFSNWLIAPGTIFWGLSLPDKLSYKDNAVGRDSKPKFAVFNSAPVFFGHQRIYFHNKIIEADELHPSGKDIWGFKLMMHFGKCKTVLENGVLCKRGVKKFVEWMENPAGDGQDLKAAEDLKYWGLLEPSSLVVVGNLAVGLDICADHRYKGRNTRMVERLDSLESSFEGFDIQLLLSAGMKFATPGTDKDRKLSLALRHGGGMALAADGVAGPTDGSKLYTLRTRDVKWSKGGLVEHRRMWFNRTLTIEKDFNDVSPSKVLGSWEPLCTNLKLNNMPQDLFDYCVDCGGFHFRGPFGEQCGEVGNWEILKVWTTPLPLLKPQKEILEISRPYAMRQISAPRPGGPQQTL